MHDTEDVCYGKLHQTKEDVERRGGEETRTIGSNDTCNESLRRGAWKKKGFTTERRKNV